MGWLDVVGICEGGCGEWKGDWGLGVGRMVVVYSRMDSL